MSSLNSFTAHSHLKVSYYSFHPHENPKTAPEKKITNSLPIDISAKKNYLLLLRSLVFCIIWFSLLLYFLELCVDLGSCDHDFLIFPLPPNPLRFLPLYSHLTHPPQIWAFLLSFLLGNICVPRIPKLAAMVLIRLPSQGNSTHTQVYLPPMGRWPPNCLSHLDFSQAHQICIPTCSLKYVT